VARPRQRAQPACRPNATRTVAARWPIGCERRPVSGKPVATRQPFDKRYSPCCALEVLAAVGDYRIQIPIGVQVDERDADAARLAQLPHAMQYSMASLMTLGGTNKKRLSEKPAIFAHGEPLRPEPDRLRGVSPLSAPDAQPGPALADGPVWPALAIRWTSLATRATAAAPGRQQSCPSRARSRPANTRH